MITPFRKATLAAGILLTGAAATLTMGSGTASAAPASVAATATPAYDFPFPSCLKENYWWVTTEAVYDHADGGTNWYRIFVNGTPPDPNDPFNPSNWANCPADD